MKKVISALVAGMLVLGCSGDDAGERRTPATEAEDPTTTATETDDPTTTAPETDDPTTTGDPPSPAEASAFVAAMRERGLEDAARYPQGDADVLDVGIDMCDALVNGRSAVGGRPASPEEYVADTLRGPFEEHLRTAVEILCPEHADLLEEP